MDERDRQGRSSSRGRAGLGWVLAAVVLAAVLVLIVVGVARLL
jgi:hypothetical protein